MKKMDNHIPPPSLFVAGDRRCDAMYLEFRNKNTVLHFNDYNIREDGSAWTCICSNCRERYRSALGDRADKSGAATGTCGIYGCNSEADDYVEFQCSHEVSETAQAPVATNKYMVFDNVTTLAKHLFRTIKEGNTYSINEWDSHNDRWYEEIVVAKVIEHGIDTIISNLRLGHAVPFCKKTETEEIFVRDFSAYLRKMVESADRLALVPPVERTVDLDLFYEFYRFPNSD